MADLIIRGMDMPEPGQSILVVQNWDGSIYVRLEPNGNIFTLVPIPEGHGRLGDLDKLEGNLRMAAAYQTGERRQGMLGCCETIRMAKSIVPAEGGGDNA